MWLTGFFYFDTAFAWGSSSRFSQLDTASVRFQTAVHQFPTERKVKQENVDMRLLPRHSHTVLGAKTLRLLLLID